MLTSMHHLILTGAFCQALRLCFSHKTHHETEPSNRSNFEWPRKSLVFVAGSVGPDRAEIPEKFCGTPLHFSN